MNSVEGLCSFIRVRRCLIISTQTSVVEFARLGKIGNLPGDSPILRFVGRNAPDVPLADAVAYLLSPSLASAIRLSNLPGITASLRKHPRVGKRRVPT